ncbi:peptide N-acetyl-beta-D-glucosaminyl asparaginase amidase A-domain-containing protein [Amylocarpus encephaloides]|uniref:Peptide N-acetyl-beta-D-glucosaminyl asparaginase amidase A-domain-containing protein n=1 Tax=Amylocarpus encephaloides TaxID=45428 RepID=A0A9P8C7T8_9HELO|nr:peptide N-acetyl-beta-D-glucosaminyl asparaginase amidase A-domain-containing protein [Amylocarpus encephaloides]
MAFMLVFACISLLQSCTAGSTVSTVTKNQPSNDAVTPLLDVIQVEAPLRASYGGASCKQTIVQHEFAASYGTPYIGSYSPPKDCKFTTTIFNMSVTSYGINFDRLALLYFGDIELWRMTTAMPVRTGIFYKYEKDLTIFDSLLRSEEKIIMTLDNIYNSVFTGSYNVTITALYFDDQETLTPADNILPISSQSSSKNQSSAFSLPGDNATTSLTLPRNVERAVVSILASGNGAEEFWFRNVINENKGFFNNDILYGYSPFREVQLIIDGSLAGVSWPFPIVFTGGISPGLWVPIVGIDTYDLPSFEIDISPWLGTLCDGNSHSFELKVVGYDSQTTLGTVNSNWVVSASVFIWSDHGGNQTHGSSIESQTPAPAFEVMPNVTSMNTTNSNLFSKLTAYRFLSHSATITTSSGIRKLTWRQDLSYTNIQNYTALGYNKTLSQHTRGISTFSATPRKHFTTISNSYSWPIFFTSNNVVSPDPKATNSTLVASIDRSSQSHTIPIIPYLTQSVSLFIPQVLSTRQNGSCIYFWNNTLYEFAGAIDPADGTLGATEQWYSYKDSQESYGRHVKAIDGYEPVLILDEEFQNTISVPEADLDMVD